MFKSSVSLESVLSYLLSAVSACLSSALVSVLLSVEQPAMAAIPANAAVAAAPFTNVRRETFAVWVISFPSKGGVKRFP